MNNATEAATRQTEALKNLEEELQRENETYKKAQK